MSEIIFNTKKLKEGIDAVANPVRITIGPKGKNVVIDRGTPLVSNDGGTIANAIKFKDRTLNMGASIIKNVINKTSERAGGGRTASAILFQELVDRGLNFSEMGIDMNVFKRGMSDSKDEIIKRVKSYSRPITSDDEVKQVATISTESEELGSVIADTINKIGKDGIVQVEEGQTFGITTEFADGLEFDKGYVSPYMVTDSQRMEAEYKNASIFITDKRINSYREIFPVIKKAVDNKLTSLVIIADDFSEDTIRNFVVMKLQGQFNVLAIKAPGFGENKKFTLQDISKMVGTEVPISFDDFSFGMAEKVVSTKDSTTIIEGRGDLDKYLEELKTQRDNTDNKMEKDQLDERIAKLSNSIAIIRVGTASDTTLNYLKQKVEDGVNEAKRALEDGVVVGGNVIFIHAIKKIKKKTGVDDYSLGFNMVLSAVEAPLRQIVKNSGGSPDVIVNKLKSSSKNAGYEAKSNRIVANMFSYGIIDAVKVPITILENAIDEASTFLTIGCSINDDQENEKI